MDYNNFQVGDKVIFGPTRSIGVITKRPEENGGTWYYIKCLDGSQSSGNPFKPKVKTSGLMITKDLTSKMVKSVNSSTIKSYVYHNKSLIVTFLNGGVYQYLNVPLKLIKDLKKAYSPGSFLNDEIKPKFDYIKLA
jgi:KTSC domain